MDPSKNFYGFEGFYGFVLWEAPVLWVEIMGVTLVYIIEMAEMVSRLR
jgi:hypothetical protein